MQRSFWRQSQGGCPDVGGFADNNFGGCPSQLFQKVDQTVSREARMIGTHVPMPVVMAVTLSMTDP